MQLREFATLVFLTVFLVCIPLAAQESEFKPIFDGRSLAGWQGDEKLWRVEGGAIVGETSKDNKIDSNQFLVWEQGEVDDFVLKASFRVSGTLAPTAAFNSAAKKPQTGALRGYQADIDRSGQYVGILYSEQTGRGILCQRGQQVTIRNQSDRDVETVNDGAQLLTGIEMDGWNEMEINGRGNRLVVKINGQVMSELVDEEAEHFKKKGLLGLQLHVGPPMKIEFKDVLLKRLPLTADNKKIVFIAGTKSHGYGGHEHNAGCLLLADRLEAAAAADDLPVVTTVYQNGWPQDPTALDNADTVVVYCDGADQHFLHEQGEAFEGIMHRGVGLVCIHFGVEVPKGLSGQRFLNWIGGYFEHIGRSIRIGLPSLNRSLIIPRLAESDRSKSMMSGITTCVFPTK